VHVKATNQPYSIEDSDDRITEILAAADESFVDAQGIPDLNRLSYTNGFYVECAALFIDIRGSSTMTAKHRSSTLGKIYRAYISECIAVINQDENCREIFIQGDCVGSIFHTPTNAEVSSVFYRAGQLNSLINLLNWRLEQKGYPKIRCGIGMSVGRALMMKAGFKGSAINDLIWMGKVVNESAKLCHQGNRDFNSPIQVSLGVYQAVPQPWKNLLNSVGNPFSPSHFQGDFVSTDMRDWTDKKMNVSRMIEQLLRNVGITGEHPAGGLRKA
jgi:class 3 adenylate cyclase